ncbi:D12 class N6 adenine-specific DNA methyltransferase [Desulfitobacterium hafniense DCB-2]|uniref:site-specific DNA-methyltransferase (adenine-specific) n=2 Tax=Desulfitobacterium hafniense TaxID=49338 RepID=A0A098AX19_DESHA|nr:DNA adenine methylase [Desulfitobacterium hafniense]ACL18698.1 D12 class N6 adenine-specific DNA methyltransferase [Desulfitobacterium hafniense DCB-2]CDX00667.1 D12 class N6 adenine-specific DNA methyltransferase [Desulfitobacterium hafniense]
MAKSLSPLRYPGGKSKIYEKVKNLIVANGYEGRTYVEPFAGGFGIGIGLLCEGVVKAAILNDYDSHIYNFWYSLLNDTENLLRLISDTPITIEERERQKLNYRDADADSLRDGFATLFLNRVNFSGVIKGGPIGGLAQTGTYKVDCRFNKADISSKIETIAKLKGKIKLYNKDAGYLIRMSLMKMKAPMFLNIDPPYVIKGSQLYTNFFTEGDHLNLQRVIVKYLDADYPWIITYDDCPLVRDLYKRFHLQEYGISHNAGGTVPGKEIVITNLPTDKFVWD